MIVRNIFEGHVNTVQLASNFTLKREHSCEPRRIFKSSCELLASARTSLAERLRVLTSYLRVHDYCTSAKYSRTFAHVAGTQALTSSADACHEIATYVCIRERIRLHRNNPTSRLFAKPSIHTKELTKITEHSSRRCRKIYFHEHVQQ